MSAHAKTAERREPVALLIADHGLHATAAAFLERARALDPSAKRILMVELYAP
jgi:hypothetical protein